jgi:hypothetical protein
MQADEQACLRRATHIACRIFDSLNEADKRDVLKSLIMVGTPEEVAAADKSLFCMDELREAQLTLKNILEGSR